MPEERRESDRRKNASAFRVDVTRLEFDQLRAVVMELAARVAELQKQLNDRTSR
jgi:hypothetical protein